MKIGLEFTFKNNEVEYFDPVTDFIENHKEYSFYVGGHEYVINKEEVSDIREYDCCQECGYELYTDGCRNCND